MEYAPKPNTFSIPIRIYYEDTDAGGVVYHANYLRFFERCRTEWVRAAGYDQSGLAREAGIALVVRSVSCDYLMPARLDDTLTVGLEVERVTGVQVLFRQHIRRSNPANRNGWDELATGKVQVVCVTAEKMKPTPIPPFLRTKLEALQ